MELLLQMKVHIQQTFSAGMAVVTGEVDGELKEFVDKDKGFKLCIPAAWEMVGKAGADALFRNPSVKSTTVGVTIYPARVKSTPDFGTLEDAENRLVAVEKAKVWCHLDSLLTEYGITLPVNTHWVPRKFIQVPGLNA